MRTEGVYTYLCSKCGTFFAVVSRFSVSSDYFEMLMCPKCGKDASITGEGSISHQTYESKKVIPEVEVGITTSNTESDGYRYPEVLTAEHIAEILGISKRIAYELMERRGFPLIRIGRLKRTNRDEFFRWQREINK